MRTVVVAVAAACLVVAFPPRAEAHHLPNTYCSDSGELCQSSARVQGARRLQIRLVDEDLARYRLCVIGPDDVKTCKGFALRDDGGSRVSSVRWLDHFPDQGSGPYVVVWKTTEGVRIGKRLGFHE